MRRPKKSETLEVRLPHQTKQAFMARCRADGLTASQIVREAIEAYLGQGARSQTARSRPMTILKFASAPIALGLIGAASLSLLAPASRAAPDLKAAFARLDADHDGKVTVAEFLASQGDMIFIKGPPPRAGADGGPPPGGPFRFRLIGTPEGGPPPAPPPGARALGPEERRRVRMQEFVELDHDADQAVSFEEFRRRQAILTAQTFLSLDRDSDGKVTAAEYAAAPIPPGALAGFQALDADHDGAVSRAEFEAGA